MSTHPLTIIIGTRPEGIKMMPVYVALKKEHVPVTLISTGQHKELLHEVFAAFDVKPDIDLGLGKPNQSLSYLTYAILQSCQEIFTTMQPRLVMVQGDTTTAMAASMQAFYQRIPVAHVEAGLRTDDMDHPYPEEFNRRVIALIARYHFAPTAQAIGNLLAEGIAREAIYHTGNTIVDALHHIQQATVAGSLSVSPEFEIRIKNAVGENKKIVLLTAHRRESFDGGIAAILQTVKAAAQRFPHLFFVYPAHPNPRVQEAITQAQLHTVPNIFLTPPLSYIDLVYVLTQAAFVMTDSGGIQEEAVSLGKQTLVLRNVSERMEGVWEGLAHLVGTDEVSIGEAVEKIVNGLDTSLTQQSEQKYSSVYGDGRAAERIANILKNDFLDKNNLLIPRAMSIIHKKREWVV